MSRPEADPLGGRQVIASPPVVAEEGEGPPVPAGDTPPVVPERKTSRGDAHAAGGAPSVASPVAGGGAAMEMEPYAAWLSSRPARHYTLQLIALAPADARRFVAEHDLGDGAVLLPRRGPGGRPMLAVVYGDFASREAAQRRSKALRREIPGLSPWLRRFADIQAELTRRGAGATAGPVQEAN